MTSATRFCAVGASGTILNLTISTDATLSVLSLSTGTFTPVFASATNTYNANVSIATDSIKVTPTTNYIKATVTVNGAAVTSGSASASLPLNLGSNTITMVVTAQDGIATKTYTLTVIRASTIASITSASAYTNDSSQTFTATFADVITGLTASNFSSTQTGVSGASIASVTGSGLT